MATETTQEHSTAHPPTTGESAVSAGLTFAPRGEAVRASDEARERVLADPGFGDHFTDHMATASWSAQRGWHDDAVIPYGPLSLDPSTAVLHYAQEIFEGLKAYRHADGSVWSFRPDRNAARFALSARRLSLPELPEADFLASLTSLVRADEAWVPSRGEQSLYLRPFMFAAEAFLGVRPATQVRYLVIASPAGAYFRAGVRPVSIWLSRDLARAAPGGTGEAKCGGNYAASLQAQAQATAHGCEQVCFLDATEHRWIEELGGMNLFFVADDGAVVTPELSGTILRGVTRDSVIQLLRDRGHEVTERRVGVEEWIDGARSGRVREVFACGTAAVITPIGRLAFDGGEVVCGDGDTGEVTAAVRADLLDLQYGRTPDRHGWLHRLV